MMLICNSRVGKLQKDWQKRNVLRARLKAANHWCPSQNRKASSTTQQLIGLEKSDQRLNSKTRYIQTFSKLANLFKNTVQSPLLQQQSRVLFIWLPKLPLLLNRSWHKWEQLREGTHLWTQSDSWTQDTLIRGPLRRPQLLKGCHLSELPFWSPLYCPCENW